MGIKVVWDNPERTIICFVFEGQWTWTEMQAARRQQHQMLEQVPHVVDVIMDFTQGRLLPQNPIAQLRQLSSARPVNTGIVILVGANPLIQTVARMYGRLYSGEQLRFDAVHTREQARSVSANHRAAYPPD